MTPIRAVLLDLDDTLCDSEGLTPIRLQAVREALADSVEPALLARVMEEALTWDSVGVPGRFLNRMSRIAEQLDLDDDATQFMRSVYNGVLMDNLRLYDGVEDTLNWLRATVQAGPDYKRADGPPTRQAKRAGVGGLLRLHCDRRRGWRA